MFRWSLTCRYKYSLNILIYLVVNIFITFTIFHIRDYKKERFKVYICNSHDASLSNFFFHLLSASRYATCGGRNTWPSTRNCGLSGWLGARWAFQNMQTIFLCMTIFYFAKVIQPISHSTHTQTHISHAFHTHQKKLNEIYIIYWERVNQHSVLSKKKRFMNNIHLNFEFCTCFENTMHAIGNIIPPHKHRLHNL